MADAARPVAVEVDRAPSALDGRMTMGIAIMIPAWHGPLCHALWRLLRHPPSEVTLFRHLLSHSVKFGSHLERAASERTISKHSRKPEVYPIASFLLGMPSRPLPLETTLAWIILDAQLCGGNGHLVKALSRVVRGLTGSGDRKLRGTLAECDGPSSLLAKMERLGADPIFGVSGHQSFDALWRSDLQAFCVSLLHQATFSESSSEGAVSRPIDQSGPLMEDPWNQDSEDPDESIFTCSRPVGPEQVIHETKMRGALDWSEHLSRQSSPDLLRPAGNVIPAELHERQWQLAVNQASAALLADDLEDAQYRLIAVLSIEVGLNMREAASVAFGQATDGRIPVVDLVAHALRRPEIVPPNYFIPKDGDDRWLATGGDAIFPLSLQCIALASELLGKREKRKQGPASSLLLEGDLDKSRLRAAIDPRHRTVLAIALFETIGLDAAQRAFGDSFGLSTAGTFYGSYPAHGLAQVIVSTNAFAQYDPSLPWVEVAGHSLGTRVRPKQAPYAQVWNQLQGEIRRPPGRPSDRQVLEQWRRRRDRLAIHFMLATGHRPSKALAALTLHDFVPKFALAITSDKVADPAHATRVVCTGWRFTGELESFVAELMRLQRKSACVQARDLAALILTGKVPLFSIPTRDGVEPLNVGRLLGSLDPLWGDRTNLHRHGLCQFLIEQGIDPELRYFQMGWLVHDHHATSDSAPYAPAWLGRELASSIDQWLDRCGWFGGARAREAVHVMPMLPLDDWTKRRSDHAQSIDSANACIRAEVQAAGRCLTGGIWELIRTKAQEVLPRFEASTSSDQPCFNPIPKSPGSAKPNEKIEQFQVEALLAKFSTSTFNASERHVASSLLHRALRKTAKTWGVRVYLPEVAVISRHRIPSPFLPGIGAALAQVDALQSALQVRAGSLGKPRAVEDVRALAAIAVLSIMLHTPYCQAGSAIGILKRADQSQHSQARPWLLRIPVDNEHIMLCGDQAVLASRLVGAEGWRAALDHFSNNDFSALGVFVKTLAPGICRPHDTAPQIVAKLEEVARAANTLRFNGAERLMLGGTLRPVTVQAVRAATVIDGITVAGDGSKRWVPVRAMGQDISIESNPSHKPSRDISHVMRAFDPDFEGQIQGETAHPVASRRPQLKALLGAALSKVGTTPTASRLILEYAWHLLVVGGPKSKGGQAISTIHKILYRIEPPFRNLDGAESLKDLGTVEMTAVCRVACEGSSRRSSREVITELRRFFAHVSPRHDLSEPDWGALYRAYGLHLRGGDPALVSDVEAGRVMDQLHGNLNALADADWDPAERRYREVCLAAALIAEASGARPRSIHGLTLSDIVLGAGQDAIHLHARGRFASIKTSTSAGYIPLEGTLWAKYAGWFAGWFSNLCASRSEADLAGIPLFQIPGEAIGVRYDKHRVFQSIGSLVRWSTQHPRGRTYWLRKRRVWLRHQGVLASGSTARDMARAMRLDGHALMLTPLGSYLADPAAYAIGGIEGHAIGRRAGAGDITGLPLTKVDRASHLHGASPTQRVAALLRLKPALIQNAELPAAPQIPPYRQLLRWKSLELALRDLVAGDDPSQVAAWRSLDPLQIDSIQQALRAFSSRMRVRLGAGRLELGPPRGGALSAKCLALLERQDERLVPIARDWVAVASGKLLNQGCCLDAPQSILEVERIASELGLETTKGREQDDYEIILIRFNGKDGSSGYGAWRALRWVLAVAWIANWRLETGAVHPVQQKS